MLGIEKEGTVLFLSRIYFPRSRDDFRDPLESSIREEKLKDRTTRVSSKRAVRRTNARIKSFVEKRVPTAGLEDWISTWLERRLKSWRWNRGIRGANLLIQFRRNPALSLSLSRAYTYHTYLPLSILTTDRWHVDAVKFSSLVSPQFKHNRWTQHGVWTSMLQ